MKSPRCSNAVMALSASLITVRSNACGSSCQTRRLVMVSIRRDPLADPLVRTWDSVVAGVTDSPQVDQQAFDVLNKLHDSFREPEIDAVFLGRLESQLLGMQSRNDTTSTPSLIPSLDLR